MKKQWLMIAAALSVTAMLSACTPNQTPPAEGGSAPVQSEKTAVASDIMSAIADKLGENMAATMQLDEETFQTLYGLKKEDIKQFACNIPMMNVKAEEFLIVEAAEGKADTVKEAIDNRQAALDEQWKQYLPDQYELVQNYKTVQVGNYFFFGVSENIEDAIAAFESMVK